MALRILAVLAMMFAGVSSSHADKKSAKGGLMAAAAAQTCLVVLGATEASGSRRPEAPTLVKPRLDQAAVVSANSRNEPPQKDLRDQVYETPYSNISSVLASFTKGRDVLFTAEERNELSEEAPSLVVPGNVTAEQLAEIPSGHYRSLTHINELEEILASENEVFLGEQVLPDGFLEVDVWVEQEPSVRVMVTKLAKDQAISLMPLPLKAIIALTAAN